MKHLLILFLLCISTLGTFAQTPKNDFPKDIVILPTRPISTGKPRTPVQPDIEACYSNEMLTLIFNNDLGDAAIVVTNLTPGDIWSGSASGICSTTILLSGDEGYYQISIFTDNEEYFGEFTL